VWVSRQKRPVRFVAEKSQTCALNRNVLVDHVLFDMRSVLSRCFERPFRSLNFFSTQFFTTISARSCQPVRGQEPYFFLCYRREPLYTMGAHEHQPIPSSRKYLCSVRFIANITHHHDNDGTSQAIYFYACYFVGLLVMT